MRIFLVILMIMVSVQVVNAGVAQVVDGDTLVMQGKTYQLIGMDAPEYDQQCLYENGSSWTCGIDVAETLANMLKGVDLTCDDLGRDAVGRILSHCEFEGVAVAQAFILIGFAWADSTYTNEYAADEEVARNEKRGLWEAKNETPAEFRARFWDAAKKLAPNGCPIKGIATMQGQFYHMPWDLDYSHVEVDPGHKGKWFCTELEAVKAGFSEPLWGWPEYPRILM